MVDQGYDGGGLGRCGLGFTRPVDAYEKPFFGLRTTARLEADLRRPITLRAIEAAKETKVRAFLPLSKGRIRVSSILLGLLSTF